VEREYTEALAGAKELNANYVAVLTFLHQEGRGSSEVYVRRGEAEVTRSIAVAAKDMGLRVILYVFPLVEDGTWRGEMAPANVTRWFETYTEGVVEYAKMAAELGADGLLIGSELSTMERYSGEWEKLIKRVREVYGGPLIYGVNRCCRSWPRRRLQRAELAEQPRLRGCRRLLPHNPEGQAQRRRRPEGLVPQP